MLKFNIRYFTLTILLFLTEVYIALYVHDNIVRPYIGDYLVVMFVYCFVKSFFDFPVVKTAIGVLIFSYFIETMQYLKMVNLLGLQDNRLARIVLGVSFEWIDMLAYTLGIITTIGIEFLLNKKRK
ncbi:ribosomal maturation YjgA family protein [Fulvivirga sediminis]|uniref:DUF2809 domain-containing protein n=1 Tax=Fulvivirga sediminis TaxID=2803949 RepID=A0A937F9L9_9BACT|nr:DUF2809 domain-containing protein [Fulvivirga sediminis]MBL3658851.1 DUF2809 domain-containing protein [Fulvivirga sediminis]